MRAAFYQFRPPLRKKNRTWFRGGRTLTFQILHGYYQPVQIIRDRTMSSDRMNIIRPLSACLGLLALSGPLAATHTTASQAWQPPAWTPLEHVQLQGDWGARFDRAAARLHKPPLNDIGYVLADLALDRKRIFTEYSGDISGRTIGVEAFLARRSSAEAAYLRALISRIPALQKPDGHFGAEQALPKINRATDMPILWGNGRLLIGLMEAYEQTGNPTALAVARKLGDYFVNTDPVYCRAENLTSVGGTYADAFSTCYFSCIEGLVALARDTGGALYRKQAERIATLALTVKTFDNLHSHGRLTALRGILALYELTGNSQWLRGVERDWRTIFAKYRLPTGGITERFSRDDQRDEGCAEADWLRLNLGLWRVTGKEMYLDEAQRCLDNHFLYNQFASGGSGHRVMQIINGAPAAFCSGGTEAYWCCCEHWPRAMIDAARLAMTAAPDGLRVNLFLDAKATIQSAGTTWRISTREIPNGLRIQVTPEAPTDATLHLRRPAWAGAAQVQTGAALSVKHAANQWAVRGRWNGTETLQLRWPSHLRSEPAPGGGTVFLAGDDLLVAHAVPANAWLFERKLEHLPIVVSPGSTAREELSWPLRVLARRASGDAASLSSWHQLELAPMRQRNGDFPHRCWFVFHEASQAASSSVGSASGPPAVYVTAASSGACAVWLNGHAIGSSSGWSQPIDGFEPADSAGENTLLIVCAPAASSAQAPGIIAAVCAGHDVVHTTAGNHWRVAALSPAEAKAGFDDILRRSNWQTPSRFPADQIPSRENRASPLEDLPAHWLTGHPTQQRPILAFKLDWD